MSRHRRQLRRTRSKGGAGRILALGFGLVIVCATIGVISAVGYVVSIANSGPALSELKPKTEGLNSIIYANDGTKLAVVPADVLRQKIPSRMMPRTIRQATVAIEDKRFYKHGGVDFEGVVRAAVKNLKSHRTVQGGSTLSMQLIRNMYTGDRKKDYKRKIREAKLAEELENIHPGKRGKEWILSSYLNNVPYGTVGGQTAYGIQSAARVFFAKTARQLTLPESALLAGLPQAPTDDNPYLHPQAAMDRRAEVLKQMHSSGYITAEQEAEAAQAPLGVQKSGYYRDKREAYFVDYVRRELVRKYGLKKVQQGGLKVYTTINLKDQELARKAIARSVGKPGSPSSALVSIDPRTGYIKAMASSSKYSNSKFNYASQAERQPGSTFKMIDLMAALRKNVDINKTTFVSKKLNFRWHGIPIDVNTDDGHPSGKAKTLFEGIVSSDNTVFQQLYLDLGPKNVTKTARDMGINSKLESYPSEGLGGPSRCCTVLEMARAYVSINDGGYRKKPIAIKKVVFPGGRVDRSLGRTQAKKIFTDGQTGEAIKAMEANVKRGTGTKAQLDQCTAAGKTGTTSGFKDAWFNGMTPHLNTTVWVGFPNAAVPMISVPGGDANPSWPGEMFGGDAPATIWHDFMSSVVTKKNCGAWRKPKQKFDGHPLLGEFTANGHRTSTYGNDIYDKNTSSQDDPQQIGTGGYNNFDDQKGSKRPVNPGGDGDGFGNNGGAGSTGTADGASDGDLGIDNGTGSPDGYASPGSGAG